MSLLFLEGIVGGGRDLSLVHHMGSRLPPCRRAPAHLSWVVGFGRTGRGEDRVGGGDSSQKEGRTRWCEGRRCSDPTFRWTRGDPRVGRPLPSSEAPIPAQGGQGQILGPKESSEPGLCLPPSVAPSP